MVRNARRALRRSDANASGRLAAAVAQLETVQVRTVRIVAQTPIRLSGQTPDGATRLVSLHDPEVRPIPKGRLNKPVEFDYKAQVADNADGVVLDHNVEIGNLPDAPQLAPAIRRIKARTAGGDGRPQRRRERRSRRTHRTRREAGGHHPQRQTHARAARGRTPSQRAGTAPADEVDRSTVRGLSRRLCLTELWCGQAVGSESPCTA